MTYNELKNKWFSFFERHGFKKIEGYSIVPENDPSVLFTTAGMHPLVPYLLGQKHPAGSKICNAQRCLRTNDIDHVGDGTHLTFFEMLGAWTLGQCNKTEMINLSFEFLTKELGLKKENLAATVFAGDENAPRDEESATAWKNCGIKEVFFLPKSENWWETGGGTGPCGPDSEMFIDTGKEKCSPQCSPACDCGKYIEIWNDVFMQFNVAKQGEKPQLLEKPNIDSGLGLERVLSIINGYSSVYEIGALKKAIDFVKKNCKNFEEKSARIIVDHIRAATFVLGDQANVLPSNVGQGYVLRRLIRRAVNCARKISLETRFLIDLAGLIVKKYQADYVDLLQNQNRIKSELGSEIEKFAKAIDGGHKEFEKVLSGIEKHIEFAKASGEKVDRQISGKAAFRLYDTFGFPLELTKEMAAEKGFSVDEIGFKNKFKEHQEKSRTANAGVFKGGLADESEMSARYHTATHLLLAGLKKLNPNVEQKGSNINSERLRFDFNFDHKLSADELKFVEDFVNEQISKKLDVTCQTMPIEKARAMKAHGTFSDKYAENVKVYSIGDVSCEICGGPHANNTAELGKFKIVKEESSSAGVRRIKAVLGCK